MCFKSGLFLSLPSNRLFKPQFWFPDLVATCVDANISLEQRKAFHLKSEFPRSKSLPPCCPDSSHFLVGSQGPRRSFRATYGSAERNRSRLSKTGTSDKFSTARCVTISTLGCMGANENGRVVRHWGILENSPQSTATCLTCWDDDPNSPERGTKMKNARLPGSLPDFRITLPALPPRRHNLPMKVFPPSGRCRSLWLWH